MSRLASTIDALSRSTPEQRNVWTWKAALRTEIFKLEGILRVGDGAFLGNQDSIVIRATQALHTAKRVLGNQRENIPTIQKYKDLLAAFSLALQERAKLKRQGKNLNLAEHKALKREEGFTVQLWYYWQLMTNNL